jgi:hypothetical protein
LFLCRRTGPPWRVRTPAHSADTPSRIAARPKYKILERSEKVSGINYNSGGNNKGESMNFIVGLFALGVACTANHFWGNTGVLLLLAFWIGIMQGNIVDIKRKGD